MHFYFYELKFHGTSKKTNFLPFKIYVQISIIHEILAYEQLLQHRATEVIYRRKISLANFIDLIEHFFLNKNLTL